MTWRYSKVKLQCDRRSLENYVFTPIHFRRLLPKQLLRSIKRLCSFKILKQRGLVGTTGSQGYNTNTVQHTPNSNVTFAYVYTLIAFGTLRFSTFPALLHTHRSSEKYPFCLCLYSNTNATLEEPSTMS